MSSIRQACGDDSICRFTTVPRCYGHAGALAWIERQHRRWLDGSAAVLAIVPDDDPAPVGAIWLFGEPACPKLGYWVIREQRRRGFATAAVQLFSTWAFRTFGLDSIYIEIEPTNRASRGVARKVGAQRHGDVVRAIKGVPVRYERHVLRADGQAGHRSAVRNR